MDISKENKSRDEYYSANTMVRSAFVNSAESFLEALAIESFFGSESITSDAPKVPLARGSRSKALLRPWHIVVSCVLLGFGFLFSVATISSIIVGSEPPALMTILGTLFTLIFLDFFVFIRREARKKVADKLFSGRTGLTKMSKLLCTHEITLKTQEVDLQTLQKTAVELAVGARPSDKNIIKLAIELLWLYRTEHDAEQTKKAFEAHYCKDMTHD